MVITGLSITISFRSRKNRIGCERRIDISRFTVYPQQWESYYKKYEGNFTGVVRTGRVDNENLLPGTIGIIA